MTDREIAQVMIREARVALARGTRHFNRAGELLTRPEQIIWTLLEEGEVLFQPPEARG